MNQQHKEDLRVFITNGIQYVTFPDAIRYTGIDKSTLHQRIKRGMVPNVIQSDRYVFIPLEYCQKEQYNKERKELFRVIESLEVSDIPFDEINNLIKSKKRTTK